jgi:hypothetical protein
MVRAYSGGARDDLGHRFHGLNDCVQNGRAACDRIEVAHVQRSGFVFVVCRIHANLLCFLAREPFPRQPQDGGKR